MSPTTTPRPSPPPKLGGQPRPVSTGDLTAPRRRSGRTPGWRNRRQRGVTVGRGLVPAPRDAVRVPSSGHPPETATGVRSSSRRAPVGTLRASRSRARSGVAGPGKREPHAPLGRFANASVALAACVGGISVAGRAGAPALCRRGIPAHPPAAHLPLPAGLLQHKVRRHCMTGGVLRVRSGRPADRRKAPCPGGRSRPIMATCRDSKPHSRGRAPTAGLRSTESDRRSESPCESRRASPPLAEPARQGHPPSSTTRLQLQRPSAVLWQASLFKLGLCSLVCLHHTMGLESATQALSETGRPPEENFLSWRGPPGSAPT